jgi:hypothetical protein
VGAAAATIAAETGARLIINGKPASRDVRTIGGVAYAPIADIAKALNQHVVRRSDGAYEIVEDGGANQVEGIHGKVGDTLFTGQWRVTVLGVEKADTYTVKTQADSYGADSSAHLNSQTRVIDTPPGSTLVIVRLRIANGQKASKTLWIARGDSHTALTDTMGQSYPPFLHDIDGAPTQTKVLLPGSRIEFPIIFSVPKDAQLQDLVFTANNNDSTMSQKGHDVRVSLTPK